MSNDPSVFDLSAIVVANNTVKGNSITCNRLNGESIISGGTVCAVSAENVNGVAIFVYNVHITVSGVLDFLNNTGYIVFACGSGVVHL